MNCASIGCNGATRTAAPINTGRRSLMLQNQDSARTFWVAFGRPATQDAFSVMIPPGLTLTFTHPDCPTERVEVVGPNGLIAGIWEQ